MTGWWLSIASPGAPCCASRTPDIRRGVDALVAAESKCCAFLGYEVDEQPEAIVLTLTCRR